MHPLVVFDDFADFTDFADFADDFGDVDACISILVDRATHAVLYVLWVRVRAAVWRRVAMCCAAGDAPPERARTARAAPAAPHWYFKLRSLKSVMSPRGVCSTRTCGPGRWSELATRSVGRAAATRACLRSVMGYESYE